RRSSTNCDYPYEIPGVMSIKNSTFNEDRYYYFYDWEVGFPGFECVSERVPVTVVVEENSAVTLPVWTEKLSIFPNPTDGALNMVLEGYAGGELTVILRNAQGQYLRTETWRATSGNAAFKTDISNLPVGLYWLEFSQTGGSVQYKIVKK
ncbi:MAG: T9SS type A sorting domain-containing protein, partial [Saprospiraceae bacterium]|nr:T9SS type A sorting domain-containing protein [Saprospiraceae bacterium]